MSVEAQRAIQIEEITNRLEEIVSTVGSIDSDFPDKVGRRLIDFDLPQLKRTLAIVNELGEDLTGLANFPRLFGCHIRAVPNGHHGTRDDRDQEHAMQAIVLDPRNNALLG